MTVRRKIWKHFCNLSIEVVWCDVNSKSWECCKILKFKQKDTQKCLNLQKVCVKNIYRKILFQLKLKFHNYSLVLLVKPKCSKFEFQLLYLTINCLSVNTIGALLQRWPNRESRAAIWYLMWGSWKLFGWAPLPPNVKGE